MLILILTVWLGRCLLVDTNVLTVGSIAVVAAILDFGDAGIALHSVQLVVLFAVAALT